MTLNDIEELIAEEVNAGDTRFEGATQLYIDNIKDPILGNSYGFQFENYPWQLKKGGKLKKWKPRL